MPRLWIGNANNGTFTITGGLVTTRNGLDIARDNGTGTLKVAGEVFNVPGTTGTIAKDAGAGGTAILNLTIGNGVFREASPAAFAASINVRFSFGRLAQFRLTSPTDTFGTLATAVGPWRRASSAGVGAWFAPEAFSSREKFPPASGILPAPADLFSG